MNELRCAVVGCGIGGRKHIQAVLENPGCKLVAICDVQEEAFTRVEKAFPLQGVGRYTDYSKMLKDKTPDILCIATLAPTHCSIALAGLKAKVKAILAEKPIANNLTNAGLMIETCENNKVPLVITHQFRQRPVVYMARECISSGEIGKVELIDLRIKGWDMINAGVHWINAFMFFTDEAKIRFVMSCLESNERKIKDGMRVENHGITWFENENGTRGVIETGEKVTTDDSHPTSVTVYGSKGILKLYPGDKLVILKEGQYLERKVKEVLSHDKRLETLTSSFGHDKMLEMLIDQLRDKKLDYSNARQALRALEVVRAAYLSNQKREKIVLPVGDDNLDPEGWVGFNA